MEINVRVKDEVIILDLCGDIDVNAANFVETVGHCIRDGHVDILCNLEEVNVIDYFGMSVIAIAYKEVINHNGRMKVVNIPAHLKNLFSISGMDRVIEIHATEDLAINSFKEDKIIEDIKKMQLRRRFKRLPIDIKIELKSKYEQTPRCLTLDIVNLSAVGAYIFGCEHFRLGDEVLLRFKLGSNPEELGLEAKVVWLPDKNIQPHLYPGMGIEFHNLSPSVQARIVEFIERNASLLSSDD